MTVIRLHSARWSILIVEDHAELGQALLQGIRAHGLRVHLVRSCEDAVKLIESVRFDLILTDLRLGGCSGVALCEMARERDIPAILITGLASRGEVATAVNAGASVVLEKPFDIDALVRLIDQKIKENLPDEMVKRAYRKLSRSG